MKDSREESSSLEKAVGSRIFCEGILYHMIDPIYVIDSSTFEIIAVNKAFVDEHKLKDASDAVGKPCYVVTHSSDVRCDHNKEECPVAKVLETGSPVNVEHEHRHLDGNRSYVKISATPIKDGQGKIFRILFVTRDVTLRKLAEESLRESEAKYRSIWEESHQCNFLTTVEGRAVDVNQRMCDLFGYTREEMMAIDITDLYVFARDRKIFQEKMHNVGFVNDYEVKMKRKDGREIICLISAKTRKKKNDGIIISYQGDIRDVTELKRTEKKLSDAQEIILHSNKLEAVGRLAGGVAHDFNNILTAIIGYANLVKMKLHPNDSMKPMIEKVIEASGKAADITRQLLAFSRKQVMEFKNVQVNDVLTGIQSMIERTVGEDVNLEFSLDPDLGVVKADVGQLEQVIMNLAVNSHDAMPEGGKITVRTRNVSDIPAGAMEYRDISFSTGPFAEISVSDEGHGIPKDIQDKIFEPFFTTKDVGRGTGLGLSTIYGIVKQSRGYIFVTSDVGKGATFSIYLPIINEAKDAIEIKGHDDADNLPHGNETILLVEDDEGVSTYAKMLLGRLGYNTIVANDGGSALLLSEKHEGSISLMLTDIKMPLMDGRELAQRLLKIHPEMKVLFMSGYAFDVLGKDVESLTEKNFIQKPFTPEILAIKIREVLGGK